MSTAHNNVAALVLDRARRKGKGKENRKGKGGEKGEELKS